MEENTIELTKEINEAIFLDFNIITTAIIQVIDLFAGIGNMLLEIMAKLPTTLLHNIYHWIIHKLELKISKKKITHNCTSYEIIELAILIPLVKIATIKFEEYAYVLRNVYLLRAQDRSSDDSSTEFSLFNELLIKA